jgi:hypothetical protein
LSCLSNSFGCKKYLVDDGCGTDDGCGNSVAGSSLGSVVADGDLGSVVADGDLGSVVADGGLGIVPVDDDLPFLNTYKTNNPNITKPITPKDISKVFEEEISEGVEGVEGVDGVEGDEGVDGVRVLYKGLCVYMRLIVQIIRIDTNKI